MVLTFIISLEALQRVQPLPSPAATSGQGQPSSLMRPNFGINNYLLLPPLQPPNYQGVSVVVA